MIIKLGSTNKEQVKEIQEALNIWVDGDFGPKTEAAVKQFQKENGLAADPSDVAICRKSRETSSTSFCASCG